MRASAVVVVVVVTGPAMFPPKFPVVSLPTPLRRRQTVIYSHCDFYNELKTHQTSTVRDGNKQRLRFERPCRAISGLGDDSDFHPLRRLPLRLSNVTADPIHITSNIIMKFPFASAQMLSPGPGELSWYSDSLRARRPGDQIPVGGEIFRIRPEWLWDPPSLLYNGHRVFPGGKAAEAWR